MSEVGIRGIASFRPAGRLTNAEIVGRFAFASEFLSQKLGILERPVSGPEERTSDLCVEAAALLHDRNGLDFSQIGLLIVVTQTPDHLLPQTSAIVQQRLGLKKTVAAFDLNLGCSGFVYGLSTATSFMQANDIDHALLITAEQYSKILDPSDRNTVPLFGDAATATWLSRHEAVLVPGRFSFGTDGTHSKVVVAGRAASPTVESLRMDGRAIFSFAMSEVPGDVERCLASNGVSKNQIDLWVFHQASAYIIDALAKRMGLLQERVALAMAETGNTTSSTIPLTMDLRGVLADSKIRTVLISGFGVGASWASTVLRRSVRGE